MAKQLLPDELWHEIEPLLPPHLPPSPKGGRPPVEDRDAVAGTLFVLKIGIPWQALLTETFDVSGSTCWRRFDEWTKAGVWPELHRRLLNRLGKAGEVNLDRVVVHSRSVRAVKGGANTPGPTRRTGQRAAANATC
jgi:transposase